MYCHTLTLILQFNDYIILHNFTKPLEAQTYAELHKTMSFKATAQQFRAEEKNQHLITIVWPIPQITGYESTEEIFPQTQKTLLMYSNFVLSTAVQC